MEGNSVNVVLRFVVLGHHLSQDRREYIPRPARDQHQRGGMAGIQHRPLGRRSGQVARHQ